MTDEHYKGRLLIDKEGHGVSPRVSSPERRALVADKTRKALEKCVTSYFLEHAGLWKKHIKSIVMNSDLCYL